MINICLGAIDIVAIISGISLGNLLSVGLGVWFSDDLYNVQGVYDNISQINSL